MHENHDILVGLARDVEHIKNKLDEICQGNIPPLVELKVQFREYKCHSDNQLKRLWWGIGIVTSLVCSTIIYLLQHA